MNSLKITRNDVDYGSVAANGVASAAPNSRGNPTCGHRGFDVTIKRASEREAIVFLSDPFENDGRLALVGVESDQDLQSLARWIAQNPEGNLSEMAEIINSDSAAYSALASRYNSIKVR